MKYWNSKINASFVIFTFLFLSSQLCLLNSCFSQNFVFKNDLKREAINFKQVKNLIVIPIYINGKGPFNFLLDTGVDPLIITDPKLSANFEIETLRKIKINGAGLGAEIEVLLANNVQVDIGRASISNIPTVILKEEIFNLSDYLGIEIHGILGYHFFKSFLVKINYATNRLIFEIPSKSKKIKWTKINLMFFENKPYINAKITTDILGEVSGLFIVDSGASHAISLESYKNNAFPAPILNISGNLGIGLSGAISGKIGRISLLKIGNFSLNNVVANFPNYNEIAAKTNVKDRSGNIGAELLKRFNVVFDYQNKAMYLKKNASFNTVFEHDMSGLEVYIKDDNIRRYFIGRIENDSPAEKAGFKIGDELLSINFKDINLLSLDAINDILKAYDGQNIWIELIRKDQPLVKILKLKRRV